MVTECFIRTIRTNSIGWNQSSENFEKLVFQNFWQKKKNNFNKSSSFFLHTFAIKINSMVKGRLIGAEIQQQILTLREEGHKVSDIAVRCGIPERSVYRIIERGQVKNQKQYPRGTGRPVLLKARDKRRIKRKIKIDNMASTSKIISDLDLDVSKQTLLRTIKKLNFKRKKIKIKPALKPAHIEARLELARSTVHWKNKWKRVFFSDEKKFNLDGPDGYNYFWADLQEKSDKKYFSKDLHKKQSVMVWGAFSLNEKLPLVRLEGTQNGQKYSDLLEFSYFYQAMTENPILVHDNAPCHTAEVVKTKINELEIEVLDWPAYSPDLNPIENLWSYVVRKIYANGKTFDNIDALWEAIQDCWDNIPQKIIKNLVKSMQQRMISLLENGGKSLKY